MSLDLNPEEISDEDDRNLGVGTHNVVVAAARDMPDQTSRSGQYYSRVSIRFESVDEETAGKSIFADYIYEHEGSELAAEIGARGLKQLYTAGECKGSITPESLLDAKVVKITVGMSKARNGYGPRAEVKKIQPGSGTKPAAETTGEVW